MWARIMLRVWIGPVLGGMARWGGDKLLKLRKVYDEIFFSTWAVFYTDFQKLSDTLKSLRILLLEVVEFIQSNDFTL